MPTAVSHANIVGETVNNHQVRNRNSHARLTHMTRNTRFVIACDVRMGAHPWHTPDRVHARRKRTLETRPRNVTYTPRELRRYTTLHPSIFDKEPAAEKKRNAAQHIYIYISTQRPPYAGTGMRHFTALRKLPQSYEADSEMQAVEHLPCKKRAVRSEKTRAVAEAKGCSVGLQSPPSPSSSNAPASHSLSSVIRTHIG